MAAGKALLSQVYQATGLPEAPIQRELNHLLDKHGFSANRLTLDELRTVMADYLQEVLLEAKETYSE